MKISTRKKILNLLSSGKISSQEALTLLNQIEKPATSFLVLSITSNKQELPLFESGIPVDSLPEIKSFSEFLKKSFCKFHIGNFALDLNKINWQRIFELTQMSENDDLYYREKRGNSQEEQITLRIFIKKMKQ